jgi:putative membrane protein
MRSKKILKKYNFRIVFLSIAIPLIVGLLFKVKIDIKLPFFLPPIYAVINSITALLLIFAFFAIKNKKKELHERLMKTAILTSIIFLVLYILYHMTSESTKFGGEGTLKYIYYFLLLTHIVLSIAVIPFVLITYVKAITGDFERHRRIAKITFPLWLYVAISGVFVYVLIAPYY